MERLPMETFYGKSMETFYGKIIVFSIYLQIKIKFFMIIDYLEDFLSTLQPIKVNVKF